jgi:hypothetical protein
LLDIFEEIIAARGAPSVGGNALTYLGLGGADIIEQLWYEPDPLTFRGDYYYNTKTNQLFKKIKVGPVPYWKTISSPKIVDEGTNVPPGTSPSGL